MRRVICKHGNISYMFYATGCLTLVSNHGNIVGYIFRLVMCTFAYCPQYE